MNSLTFWEVHLFRFLLRVEKVEYWMFKTKPWGSVQNMHQGAHEGQEWETATASHSTCLRLLSTYLLTIFRDLLSVLSKLFFFHSCWRNFLPMDMKHVTTQMPDAACDIPAFWCYPRETDMDDTKVASIVSMIFVFHISHFRTLLIISLFILLIHSQCIMHEEYWKYRWIHQCGFAFSRLVPPLDLRTSSISPLSVTAYPIQGRGGCWNWSPLGERQGTPFWEQRIRNQNSFIKKTFI